MYLRVVLSILSVACVAIAVELAAMGRLATRQLDAAERAQVFTLDGEEPRLSPIWPDDTDPVLGRTVARLEIPPMSLEKALLEFQKQAGVNLVTPYHGIPAEARDSMVQAHLTGVTVAQALGALLDQAKPRLHYNARDSVIEIGESFVPGDERAPVTRVYDVRSLLTPPARATDMPELQFGATGVAPDPSPNLVEVLVNGVAPQSWAGNGGNGRIRVWAGNVLIISQTAENHREIARFLWTLKKAIEGQAAPPAAARHKE